MSNLKESIMLKGIAQNILQMNVPKIDNLKEMLKEFDLFILNSEALDILHKKSKENEYTIFCKGLYQIETGNTGFTMIPLVSGVSYKKMDNLQLAKNLAKGCCTWWGQSLNMSPIAINKTHLSTDDDIRNSFIEGWEKNGRYWEVHYTPNWLK